MDATTCIAFNLREESNFLLALRNEIDHPCHLKNMKTTKRPKILAGQLYGITTANGGYGFSVQGGSMGSIVVKTIKQFIEYGTNRTWNLKLIQMTQISSALYDHQSNKKLFYIAIITSPTIQSCT